MPIIVDFACRNFFQAKLFINAGAEAISVKYAKSGITESLRIIEFAQKAGIQTHIGMGCNSSFGALYALSLASGLSRSVENLPCEESFFLQFTDHFLKIPLNVSNGNIRLPDSAGFAPLIDWDKVTMLSR